MKYRNYLVATCAAVLVSVPALAQTDEGSRADGASEGNDIVVTARRRDEALQDVPISVSAISGEALNKSGVTDIQGLQFRTPSLVVGSGGAQRNTMVFSLRGQRVQETQLFTDGPVGTYFAEVVQPRPYGFGNTLFDLESVQVLKGVQGTLFGRNTTGGAVLFEPAHPKLGEFGGEVRGQYGNHDLRDIYGMVNIAIGDKIALRFAGKTRDREGWAHDIGNGLDLDNQNYDTFRVSALIEPIEGLESLTIYDWYRSRDNGSAAFLTNVRYPSALTGIETLRTQGRVTTNIPAQFAEAQALFRASRYTLRTGNGNGSNLDLFGKPREDIDNWGVTNKTTWQLSDSVTLKNIFGYRKQKRTIVQDYDGIPAFIISPIQFAHTRNVSEEFQVQLKALDNRLDLIGGAYYFEEKGLDGSQANTTPETNLNNAGFNPATDSARLVNTRTLAEGYARAMAGFVAGTFKITDQISLSGGLRYNYDKRKITASPTQPNRPNADGTVGRCLFDINQPLAGVQTVPIGQCFFTNSKSFKQWTYDATIQYEPSDAVTAYASYRHGFRAGGFSGRATSYPALAAFLPEFVNEYEVGLKTNTPLGAGRLTTSTALFLQDGTDVQKQVARAVDGNVVTVILNTAKQRNMGGEFEAAFTTRNFSLNAFYSYVDVDILEGRLVSGGGVPEFENRGVPKHTVGVTATMSPPINPDTGELTFIANWTWRSGTNLDDFEIEGYQPAYSLVNLRAEFNDIAGSRASVALFVNNALNQTYKSAVLGLLAEGLGFQSALYGEPRMYGVELGFKF